MTRSKILIYSFCNMKRYKGVTLIELLVVIGIFLVMFACLAPVVQMTKDRAERINCANNLMRISLGLHRYAQDHNDAFPTSLGEMSPNYVKDAQAFDCPASKVIGTPEKPDYNYAGGLRESSPSSDVIAFDLDDNHKKGGRNILRVNGSIEWASKGRGLPR